MKKKTVRRNIDVVSKEEWKALVKAQELNRTQLLRSGMGTGTGTGTGTEERVIHQIGSYDSMTACEPAPIQEPEFRPGSFAKAIRAYRKYREEKLKALLEAKRVTKPGGVIFVAYLMNEYSILSYCFDEDRIGELLTKGQVDKDFHIQAKDDELYDYVRIDDINRLNEKAGLERVTIFSPDGASDYMRTRLNRMSEETFAHFIEYQKCISERQDLIGAGSHVVDVVRRL
jgi:hypothetical protein